MITFIRESIHLATVFIFGSTGETLVEKGGNLNLGIPGIMCFGAIGGLVGESMVLGSNPATVNPATYIFVGILMSLLFAGLLGGLYSFFVITLRCNQNVTGLTITTFGVGAFAFYGAMVGQKDINFYYPSKAFTSTFSFAHENGFTEIFFSYGILVYLAIAVAIIVAIFLKKTKTGLHLRAVGENPAAADAAGINVIKYKYVSSIVGAAISGLGGFFYIIDNMGGNLEYVIDAMGWIAVALVIFSMWKPGLGILGGILFAALYIAPVHLTSLPIPKDIFKMMPYLVTLIVLIAISIRNNKENQAPAALGVTYFREER